MQASDLCAEFALDVSIHHRHSQPWWLTLSGVTGSGKTMLATQTYLEGRKWNPADSVGAWQTGVGLYNARNRRPGCVFVDAVTFGDRVFADRSYCEEISREFLVCIDDVGAAQDPTRRIAEAVYRLCNLRLGKWTLFTTNYSLQEMAKQVDERVASRMVRDGNIFHRINAGDYALRKTKT